VPAIGAIMNNAFVHILHVDTEVGSLVESLAAARGVAVKGGSEMKALMAV